MSGANGSSSSSSAAQAQSQQDEQRIKNNDEESAVSDPDKVSAKSDLKDQEELASAVSTFRQLENGGDNNNDEKKTEPTLDDEPLEPPPKNNQLVAPEPPLEVYRDSTVRKERASEDEEKTEEEEEETTGTSSSERPVLHSKDSWIPGGENDNQQHADHDENDNNDYNNHEENDCRKSWISHAPRKAILRSGGPRRQQQKHQQVLLRKASDSWNPSEENGSEDADDSFSSSKNVPLNRKMSDLSSISGRSNNHKKLSLNSRVGVQFSHVRIREYAVTIGDNPCCSYGVPISLDWDYEDEGRDIPIDVYESQYVIPRNTMRRGTRRSLVLTYNERRARLWKAGYTLEEIDEAANDLEREKWRQSILGNLESLYRIEEFWVLKIKPILCKSKRRRKNGDTGSLFDDSDDLDTIEQLVREEHSLSRASSREFGLAREFSSIEDEESDGNTEGDGHVIIDGLESLSDKDSRSSPRGLLSGSSDDDDYSYKIKIDKKQQNKAAEIRLRSLERPHMRAFHAAWFCFFIAFFSWFAISPLLNEIKTSLNLSKSDVWTSSLCGTAGTVVMRVLMGPLCDKFGARICMAAILIVAAIPTATTGLVQTSAGLSIVRLFIGVGGSAFVACQYWTSEMFTREVAGTANAIVAGWGKKRDSIWQRKYQPFSFTYTNPPDSFVNHR